MLCLRVAPRLSIENPPDHPKFPPPGSFSNVLGARSSGQSLCFGEKKTERDKGGACISLPWPPCCHPQSFPHTAAMVNQENRRQIKSLCSKPTPHFARVKVEVLPKVYKPLYNVPPAQPPDLTFYSPSHRSLHSSHTTSLLFLLSPLPRTPFPQMAA